MIVWFRLKDGRFLSCDYLVTEGIDRIKRAQETGLVKSWGISPVSDMGASNI